METPSALFHLGRRFGGIVKVSFWLVLAKMLTLTCSAGEKHPDLDKLQYHEEQLERREGT